MKQTIQSSMLIIIALATILATFIHGNAADISIFHGMILHPIFLLIGISLFALVSAIQNNKNKQES